MTTEEPVVRESHSFRSSPMAVLHSFCRRSICLLMFQYNLPELSLPGYLCCGSQSTLDLDVQKNKYSSFPMDLIIVFPEKLNNMTYVALIIRRIITIMSCGVNSDRATLSGFFFEGGTLLRSG